MLFVSFKKILLKKKNPPFIAKTVFKFGTFFSHNSDAGIVNVRYLPVKVCDFNDCIYIISDHYNIMKRNKLDNPGFELG